MSGLEVVLTALAIAEKLDSFEEFYKEFEKSGCIDGVENCQYHTNRQIIDLAQKILIGFCDIENETKEAIDN